MTNFEIQETIIFNNNGIMKRAMRDSHTHENDCFGEFHLAIKKQIIDR